MASLDPHIFAVNENLGMGKKRSLDYLMKFNQSVNSLDYLMKFNQSVILGLRVRSGVNIHLIIRTE
jgi:hypothetical protein